MHLLIDAGGKPLHIVRRACELEVDLGQPLRHLLAQPCYATRKTEEILGAQEEAAMRSAIPGKLQVSRQSALRRQRLVAADLIAPTVGEPTAAAIASSSVDLPEVTSHQRDRE